MPRFSSLRSARRPEALKDTDYDHEIHLIDHTTGTPAAAFQSSSARTRSHSASDGVSRHRDSLAIPPEEIDSRRHSDDLLRRKGTRATLREEIARRKYSKYQDRREEDQSDVVDTQPALVSSPTVQAGPGTEDEGVREDRPTTSDSSTAVKKSKAERESAVDVLFENQRGGFLCGLPLFSSKALGAADAPPWTNIALKPSATNTSNAQVPDPSWEWAWKEWKVNHSDEVDDDGWEYSCMYWKKCSWHGPTWYNSFVRRRAWIRKRVKKYHTQRMQETQRLNSDYFTVHPTMTRSRSPSKAPSMVESRLSREIEQVVDREDIRDIATLLAALKSSRIDREKTEAIENFIKNGGDDLFYLAEHMHDIMSQFIFQASRRSLLAHLSKLFAEESAALESATSKGPEFSDSDAQSEKETGKLPDNLVEIQIDGKPTPEDKRLVDRATAARRLQNLEKAYKAADEEVKRMEFWSDIKGMAEQGETKGAVDEEQGWDESWRGLDGSGPKDVLTDPVVGEDLDAELRPDGQGTTLEKKVSFGAKVEKIPPPSSLSGAQSDVETENPTSNSPKEKEENKADKGKGKDTT